MISPKRIYHSRHRHYSEDHRCNPADIVAEVEQADGEPAEYDGKIEPGEESPLVGEEDFGLDAYGKGDPFLGGGGEEGLG